MKYFVLSTRKMISKHQLILLGSIIVACGIITCSLQPRKGWKGSRCELNCKENDCCVLKFIEDEGGSEERC